MAFDHNILVFAVYQGYLSMDILGALKFIYPSTAIFVFMHHRDEENALYFSLDWVSRCIALLSCSSTPQEQQPGSEPASRAGLPE